MSDRWVAKEQVLSSLSLQEGKRTATSSRRSASGTLLKELEQVGCPRSVDSHSICPSVGNSVRGPFSIVELMLQGRCRVVEGIFISEHEQSGHRQTSLARGPISCPTAQFHQETLRVFVIAAANEERLQEMAEAAA